MNLRGWSAPVVPTAEEVARPLPGDELLAADVVMDRAFDLPAPPDAVWPWLLQLGKGRAGWYLPRRVERFLPPRRRALRHIDTALARLEVGEQVPDWGGRDATLTVAAVSAPATLLFTSRRGRLEMTWCLALTPAAHGSRLHARLRLGPVRRRWLAQHAGGLVDELTLVGLAGGLRERVARPT